MMTKKKQPDQGTLAHALRKKAIYDAMMFTRLFIPLEASNVRKIR